VTVRRNDAWLQELAICLRDVEGYCAAARRDLATEEHESGSMECRIANIRNAAEECLARLWPREVQNE